MVKPEKATADHILLALCCLIGKQGTDWDYLEEQREPLLYPYILNMN